LFQYNKILQRSIVCDIIFWMIHCPKEKNKLQAGFIPILIILLVVALGAGGFFVYQKYQGSQKTPPQKKGTPSVTITPSPSPQPKDDGMAGWLTFSKPNIPYTFKYPKEVELIEQEGFQLSLWGPSQKPETEFYDGISLGFSLPTKFAGGSLKDYVAAKIEEIKAQGLMEIVKPQEEITLNGLNGYTYTVSGLGVFQSIYLLSPDKQWLVEISDATNDPTHQGYLETVKKILSTFQFTQ